MTSIDDIFKASGLSNKRKLEPSKDPNEIYKSAKLGSNQSKGRHAQVQDDEGDDLEAGPPLPPDDDDEENGEREGEAYGPGPAEDENDDEDGRFFGGGITTTEAHVLDFVDSADADTRSAPDKIDIPWLRKTALSLEKRITKNAELRAKFENSPEKFMASEGDLDADIRGLSILAEYPNLYAEFARLGCVGSLVTLLAHENTDVAIATVEVINELTGDDAEATEEEWTVLVDALTEADLIGLLVSNLERLNEDDEEDRNGVYHVLSVLENLCSRAVTAELVGKNDQVLAWLQDRAGADEPRITQNKQYAAELLAILSQASGAARSYLSKEKFVDETLLLVEKYRKHNPDKGEEEEYMENLFDTLCNLLSEEDAIHQFYDMEGTELCLILIKAGKRAQMPALKLLDIALLCRVSGKLCEVVVRNGGLSTLFTLFMKKSDSRTMDHLLHIFVTMFSYLDEENPDNERIRLLAKFVEKDYQKLDKVMALRRQYGAAVVAVDKDIDAERREMDDDEKEAMEPVWASRRLDAGLFRMRMADRILAWMCREDDGARAKITADLGGLDIVKRSLEEQIGEAAGDDMESEDDATRLRAYAREKMEMLLGSLQ